MFWLLESKGNCAFKKAGKIQGRGELLRLVTPVLPTALCKSSRIRLAPNSGMVCRFPSWCVFSPLGAGGRGLWLGGLSKEGLFGCQSAPGPPYAVPSLFEIGILITEFSVSWIRGFGSRLLISNGFLGAKAGHSDRAVRRVEESCFCFWKAKETALLKKRQKSAFSKAGKL